MSTQKTITLEQFIEREQLKMSVNTIARNPHMPDMPRNFECAIRQVGKGSCEPMIVYFSQGSAHIKKPTLAEVLDCLAMDVSGVENARGFEDWCSEYGYDIDSRKAEKTYATCKKQAEQLKTLLGTDAYEQLLWHTEQE